MYYLYSLVISIVIFVIMEWRRARNSKDNNTPYEFGLSNLGNLVVIYIFVTFVYYLVGIMYSNNDGIDIEKGSVDPKHSIKRGGQLDEIMEYNILKKIPEDISVGFGVHH